MRLSDHATPMAVDVNFDFRSRRRSFSRLVAYVTGRRRCWRRATREQGPAPTPAGDVERTEKDHPCAGGCGTVLPPSTLRFCPDCRREAPIPSSRRLPRDRRTGERE